MDFGPLFGKVLRCLMDDWLSTTPRSAFRDESSFRKNVFAAFPQKTAPVLCFVRSGCRGHTNRKLQTFDFGAVYESSLGPQFVFGGAGLTAFRFPIAI